MAERPFLNQRNVDTISRLRVRGWLTSYATADPQLTVTLSYQDEDGTTHSRDPQGVTITYVQTLGTGAHHQEGAAQINQTIELRRPIALEFDVAPGDTFTLIGKTGSVEKVNDNGGMRIATCLMAV